MEFGEFTQKAWADHVDDAQGVANRLGEGLGLMTEAGQLPALASLIVHVRGEHLGQWEEGLAELRALSEHETFDDPTDPARAVYRCMAILHQCNGDTAAFESCLKSGESQGDHPLESDHARVYAIIASTLAGQDRIEEAMAAFNEALNLTTYGPVKGDPAALALAITGNNLACTLEEKVDRSAEEVELMKLAAETGRRFWEIAGDWKNVERADYRLCMTSIASGEAEVALGHAQSCLAVCEENAADACELFFANEALALANHAAGRPEDATKSRERCAELLTQQEEGMKSYCVSSLETLDSKLNEE